VLSYFGGVAGLSLEISGSEKDGFLFHARMQYKMVLTGFGDFSSDIWCHAQWM
jgi:hypothetical protein